MAEILPFRALRYDPKRVNPALCVTQPYDKITPAMQDGYYEAEPHNLVRIILGRRDPDTGGNNVYTRAAAYFREWRRDGTFLQDEEPSVYFYSQKFRAPGARTELERRGFIALGRIEDYSAKIVFRHEQTLAKPKADRLELLRATQAHFGQIFMLYDGDGELENRLATGASPDTQVEDEYGVVHRLWRVSDAGRVGLVRNMMKDKKLIIADGHHRYETALAYRDERRHQPPGQRGKSADKAQPANQGHFEPAPYDFVMMTFINMNDPGLLILPTHRVVHGLPSFSPDDFVAKTRAYFDVEELNDVGGAAQDRLPQAGESNTAMLALTRERAFLLHSPRAPHSLFGPLSPRQRALDVIQLHKVLLENVLGLSEESIRNQENLSYVRDVGEVRDRVKNGANLAFVMNPVRMNQVRDVAFAGEVLPQKSTDFYPKLLSGLTIYTLD